MDRKGNNIECVLNIKVFTKYFKLLLLNYNKTHTQELFNLYYASFKDCEEKDFKKAIEMTIKNQKYFPNIAEIYQYLPTKDVPKWFNQDIKSEEASEEEIKELEELLKEFRNGKEESR